MVGLIVDWLCRYPSLVAHHISHFPPTIILLPSSPWNHSMQKNMDGVQKQLLVTNVSHGQLTICLDALGMGVGIGYKVEDGKLW